MITHPKKKLTFVLAGGGSRGALQVGALRALLEADIQPDFLVGSSAGAINAVFLSLYGFSSQGLDALEEAWRIAAKSDLLPAQLTWLTLRVLFNRAHAHPYHRLRDYFISQGVLPNLTFGDLSGTPALLVSADLNTFAPHFYGNFAEESVLEGLLASTALPPWMYPLEKEDAFLMDGGVVSNLPIEPAILHGATEIIALGLSNPAAVTSDSYGFTPFFEKLLTTIEERQIYMEQAFARASKIPLLMVDLKTESPVAIWDFSRTEEMFKLGYQQMQSILKTWQAQKPKKNTYFTRLKNCIKAI